jgi:hypothetical protein
MNESDLYPYQRRYLNDHSGSSRYVEPSDRARRSRHTLEAVLDCLDAETQGKSRDGPFCPYSQAALWTPWTTARSSTCAHSRPVSQALSFLFAANELAFEVRLPKGAGYGAWRESDTARGMTENLILDEFAHHKDNRAIWKALFSRISRPDLKLRVISTPGGVGDKFHEIRPIPSRSSPGYFVTIYDAVADGLPRDIEELRPRLSIGGGGRRSSSASSSTRPRAWLPYELVGSCEDDGAGLPAKYSGGLALWGWTLPRAAT